MKIFLSQILFHLICEIQKVYPETSGIIIYKMATIFGKWTYVAECSAIWIHFFQTIKFSEIFLLKNWDNFCCGGNRVIYQG